MVGEKRNLVFTALFLFGTISIVFIYFLEPIYQKILTAEDSFVENLSAIFYLIAFIAGVMGTFKIKGKENTLAILWTFLCLVFLGEETSWFQGIFHYPVPYIEQLSGQREFNIHHFKIFHGKSSIESVKLVSFLNAQNLFRMGFFGYFLILPLLTHIPGIKFLLQKVGYKKPEVGFVIVLTTVFFISFFLVFFASPITRTALAETREMLYSFFIMIYVFVYIWPTSKSPDMALISIPPLHRGAGRR